MNLSTLMNFCKEKYPDKMVEICEAIDLLVDSLNGLKSDIGKAIPLLNDNEDFELMHQYTDYSKEIVDIIQNLNNISNDITIEEDQSDETGFDEEISSLSSQDINYNDKSFNVDTKVPHTVYEDFTYTRPAGIKIEETYLEANEWRDVFNKTCQYLLRKNKNIFISFLTDDTMRGRSRKYFSYNPSELREAEIIKGSNIYIECNVNAIFVRNIIIKMLEKYEIPKRQCSIFIRRDLTSLHQSRENKLAKETADNLEQSDDEIKIGKYAKNYFLQYFKPNHSISEILQFTNKEWCHDTFGICYPILKQVDTSISISEQVNYNNQYRRYYSSPVLNINDKHYIICSQWFSSFKSKLIDWINNKDILKTDSNTMTIKLGKEYCSIGISKGLFVYILKTIEQYKNTYFETGKLSNQLSTIILQQTKYEKAHHVINNIRKYLEDKNIIALYENCKKGKYYIVDLEGLQKLINEYSPKQKSDIPKDRINYGCRVIVYSYHDKKQIFVNVGDMSDEFVYLHDDCLGKKGGDKFSFNNKEYVIVSFKRNK